MITRWLHLVLHHPRAFDQEPRTLQRYVRIHQFFSRNSPGDQICRVVHPWTMRPSLLRSLDFTDAIGNESFDQRWHNWAITELSSQIHTSSISLGRCIWKCMKLQAANGIPATWGVTPWDSPRFQHTKPIQRRKRIWYSGGTSSSHPSSRVDNFWNRHLACNTYGAANPNGSKSFEKKLSTILLVIHKFRAKTEPLNVKQSSDASHNKPRTLNNSRSRYLSLKSWCNISATSGLLDPHFTKGMLALDIVLIASFTMVPHSSTESAPDKKSSTYKFSFNSSTTLNSRKPEKWNGHYSKLFKWKTFVPSGKRFVNMHSIAYINIYIHSYDNFFHLR